MSRVFDPIDIVFIVLISLYLFLLVLTIFIWFKTGNKNTKILRYKVVKIIHPKKKVSNTPNKNVKEKSKLKPRN